LDRYAETSVETDCDNLQHVTYNVQCDVHFVLVMMYRSFATGMSQIKVWHF